jgi:hypothetical protein
MDLRFVPPELRRLDDTAVELCACGLWRDERPPRGLAALLDWRLGGRLTALMKRDFVRGELGEALLVPGKPHVPFEKLLLVGVGDRAAFDEGVFRRAVERIARSLEGLRVRRAVVELPGRAANAVSPERAIELTLECVGASTEHDAWWLVEDTASQKRMEQRADDERRRARMG